MLGLQRVRDRMLIEELLALPVGTPVVGELPITRLFQVSWNR